LSIPILRNSLHPQIELEYLNVLDKCYIRQEYKQIRKVDK